MALPGLLTAVLRLLFPRRNFTLAFQAAESVGIKSTLVRPHPEGAAGRGPRRSGAAPAAGTQEGADSPPCAPRALHGASEAAPWLGVVRVTVRGAPQQLGLCPSGGWGPRARGARGCGQGGAGLPCWGQTVLCGGSCLISKFDFKGENAASKYKASLPAPRDAQLRVSAE